MKRHMQRHLGALVLSIALLSAAPAAHAQYAASKVAVVDLEVVVGGSELGQRLQRDLAAFQDRARVELKAKQDEAVAVRAKITPDLTPGELERLQKQYEDAAIAMKRLQDDKQREGQVLQDEGLKAIDLALGPILTAIREEEGFDLILNRTAGVVLLVSDRVDITRQVIERFNSQTSSE